MTSQRSLNEKLIAETRAKVEQEIADWLVKTGAKYGTNSVFSIPAAEAIRNSSYRKETT